MALHRYFDDLNYRTGPRMVKGGIRAQHARGPFVKSWWGKAWVAIFAGFNAASRLSRGRDYARKGQVCSLDIDKGFCKAQVVGSYQDAYEVSIELKALSSQNWDKVLDVLAEKPLYLAQFMADDMPQEILSVFEELGLSLFPKDISDLKISCSCPDKVEPCKHMAAVLYLMGEAFDLDPFILFNFRGLDRKQFEDFLSIENDIGEEEVENKTEDLDFDSFWKMKKKLNFYLAVPDEIKVHAAMPKRLGKLPFWRSEHNFSTTMEELYKSASDDAKSKLST